MLGSLPARNLAFRQSFFRQSHESIDGTLAYLKGKVAEMAEGQEHSNSTGALRISGSDGSKRLSAFRKILRERIVLSDQVDLNFGICENDNRMNEAASVENSAINVSLVPRWTIIRSRLSALVAHAWMCSVASILHTICWADNTAHCGCLLAQSRNP
jgi:hypothetical protein